MTFNASALLLDHFLGRVPFDELPDDVKIRALELRRQIKEESERPCPIEARFAELDTEGGKGGSIIPPTPTPPVSPDGPGETPKPVNIIVSDSRID